MHLLAIDLGDKRTGLAVGDTTTKIVTPAGVLEIPRGPALLDALCAVIAERESDELVVGLPLHVDGRESERSKIVREFGQQLLQRTGRPVHYQDERFTSFSADQLMAQSGRTRKQKKQVRDAIAAAEILRDYLEGMSLGGSLES